MTRSWQEQHEDASEECAGMKAFLNEERERERERERSL